MKKISILAASLSLLAAAQGFAATDPVSVAVETALTSPGVYDVATPFAYDLTNNTSKTITGLTVALEATGGTAAETSGCATIAPNTTCEWAGTLTPDSDAATAQATLKYNGIEVSLAKQSMTATDGPVVSYVAAGANSNIKTSVDGVTWDTQTVTVSGASSGDVELDAVAYGNNKWVVVGEKSSTEPVILTSPNGVSWTEKAVPTAATNDGLVKLLAVAYANGTWVAAGRIGASGYTNTGGMDASQNLILTSVDDGETWVNKTTTRDHWAFERLVYDNGNWYGFGWDDYSEGIDGIAVSTDNGNTWNSSEVTTPATNEEYKGAATDGTNWVLINSQTSGSGDQYTGTWSGGDFVWRTTANFGNQLSDIAYADSTWVVVGGDGGTTTPIIRYSRNTGVGWSDVDLSTYTNEGSLQSVTHVENPPSGGPDWVAVGSAGLFTSADGIAWTQRLTTNALGAVAGR